MRYYTIFFVAFLILAFSKSGIGQQQLQADNRITLANWLFKKDSLATDPQDLSTTGWSAVTVPHSWNTQDVMDDVPGYYRNKGWYKLQLPNLTAYKGKNLRLHFDGANQEVQLFVNGKAVGTHVGGYTAFSFIIDPYIDFSNPANEVFVLVNNRFNPDIPPLTADFTFFGGIYRNVYLEVLPKNHFSDPLFGSKGVFYQTTDVTAEKAQLRVFGRVQLQDKKAGAVRIKSRLLDSNQKLVAEVLGKLGAQDSFKLSFKPITNPKLWSPENPYRYTLETMLLDKNGAILDKVIAHVGFRYFHFDPKTGFHLNGKPYKLIGVSRHQDFKGLGNAVPYDLQVQDLHFLKDMGGNFLRVAHYPQIPAIMEACDSLGILTSVEIPLVNEITESSAFTQHSLHMQEEMIRQNYNYCSVIIWAHMNEILLRPKFNADKPRQEVYFQSIYKLAKQLDSLTRRLDPYRYTMLAHHGAVELYHRVGLTRIAMLNGWNLYPGWYGGTIADFGKQLDHIHAMMPDIPFMVTEYGADADPRIHAFDPIRFDKSVEYAVLYHKGYLKDFFNRPFVAGAFAWNLSDFNSETRAESMPHINNKGLLTWDRYPKNTYYLYQAALKKEPFLQIGTALWRHRGGIAADNITAVVQPLEIYSNQHQIELTVNGKAIATKTVQQHSAIFDVPFTSGLHILKAAALDVQGNVVRTQTDSIHFQLVDPNFVEPFKNTGAVHFSLGENRYVLDADKRLWIPLRQQQGQLWGLTGGKDFKLANRGEANVGTDRNIAGTDLDPVYQTQQVGLEELFFPLPEGRYKVVLHFAELSGAKEKEALPYDLENPNAVVTQLQNRVFNVYLNHSLWLNDFDLIKVAGTQKAHEEVAEVQTYKNQGLRLKFEKIIGDPVLNAISIYKL